MHLVKFISCRIQSPTSHELVIIHASLVDFYRVSKEGRAAGVLENYAEGEKYAEHGLRKFLRTRAPEIMPSINRFFANPK